jgi:hypothetical protein
MKASPHLVNVAARRPGAKPNEQKFFGSFFQKRTPF